MPRRGNAPSDRSYFATHDWRRILVKILPQWWCDYRHVVRSRCVADWAWMAMAAALEADLVAALEDA